MASPENAEADAASQRQQTPVAEILDNLIGNAGAPKQPRLVTPADFAVSKVNRTDTAVAEREKTRERVRRHRAIKKQTASIEFVRTDASLFLQPDRLSQKAGAPKALLRRMALKELVDNALDAAPATMLTTIDQDTFNVEDDGPGIAPQKVVALFSVTRPMMSTKLIRRPTRGMVGNGLRVATGAAFASGGNITVESFGIRQELTFDRTTGDTIVTDSNASPVTTGTRITVRFGSALPRDSNATCWGDLAIKLAGQSAKPMLTHPDWYSELAFKELTDAARGTANDLASLFGIDLRNAARPEIEQLSAPERYIDPDAAADQLSLDCLKLLAPKQPRLIPIADDAFDGCYSVDRIEVVIAGATVPAIVQAWASARPQGRNAVDIELIVNRTRAVADLSLYPGGESYLTGCGLQCLLGQVPKGGYRLTIAITTPAIALVNDGKTPDLTPFRGGLTKIVGPVLRRAHRPKSRGISIKDAAFEAMEQAYLKASAGNTLPANARQIMYAARPHILERTGQNKLNDSYFTQALLPAFLDDNPDLTADWDVVYDARGHLVEPHTDYSLPLGTISRPRVPSTSPASR